jgi:hypothetical protein
MSKVTTITTENATSLLIAGTISSDQFDAFFKATLAEKIAEAETKTAGKVHFGTTAGGAINLRGVPGSPGSFGLTLYSATVRWIAANIDDVVAHCDQYAAEDFQRGSDGRIVRITADRDESTAQKARCEAEIVRWVVAAEDQLAAGLECDELWGESMAEEKPNLGGVYPPAKLAKMVKKDDFSDSMAAKIAAERKRS